MKKLLIAFLFISMNTIGAHSQTHQFILKGSIEGIQDQSLFLYQETGENLVLLDSTSTKNGSFHFIGECKQAFVAQLALSNKQRIKFFISPSEMVLTSRKNDFNSDFLSKKLSGSEAQDRYENFQELLAKNDHEKLKLSHDLKLPEVIADANTQKLLQAKYQKKLLFKKEYFHNYASSPVVSYLIFQDYFEGNCNLKEAKEYLKTLKMANPNGLYVQNLTKRIENIDKIFTQKEFPEINATSIKNESFNSTQRKAAYQVYYIWRAWTPNKNEIHYQRLNQLQDFCQKNKIELVSIIRNSSFNKIPVEGSKEWKMWRPEINPEHQYIEIESLDNSLELIRYLDRQVHVMLVNREGKILSHENTSDVKLLLSSLTQHISKP
jgi:hypothetical protein